MGKNGTFLVCHDDDGPPRLRKSFIAFPKKKNSFSKRLLLLLTQMQ